MAIFGRIVSAGEDDVPNAQRKAPEAPEQREASVRADITKRLKTVCKDLPDDEFQELVAAMTREQLRSERLY